MPKVFLKARDPLSCYTHFIGLILSVIGTGILILKMMLTDFAPSQICGLLFCLSLAGLYGASSLYHSSNKSAEEIKKLRKLDHSMIYVLIAGSYTPVLYSILPEPKSMIFITIMWVLAVSGIIMKLFWIDAPRWLCSSLYILMGWAIAVDFPALASLKTGAIILLAAGGIFYTVGGIIYAIKKPNISKLFGFHEIFHIFVILGSICHYLMIMIYLI